MNKSKSSRWVLGLIVAAGWVLVAGWVIAVGSAAIARAADVAPLVRDTQVTRSENGKVMIVWWIPNEFWELSFKDNPAVPAASQKEVLDTLGQYVVLAVVEGKIGPLGGFNGESREKLLAKTSIKIGDKTYKPLADADISDAAQTLFQTMKPLIGSSLGKLGQSLEFIAFEGRNKKGQRLLDPMAKGMLTVNFGENEFKWRLPLGSLLPPKFDGATGEQFPGNFEFSPYTGAKLTTEKAK